MNRVVHFEVHAQDMDTMQRFYGEVFGSSAESHQLFEKSFELV